jgi:hypothetical protein
MTYEDLIRIADRHYPDGLVMEAYETGGPVGDTIALYIVNDLAGCVETNPNDPLDIAVSRINTSIHELMEVANGLEAERQQRLEANGIAPEDS